jgi:hypothetical protein
MFDPVLLARVIDDAVREVEIRCPFPGPIEDQQLLLAEHGFGDY